MNASSMKLSTRLGLGFAVVLALLVLISGIGILKLYTLRGEIDLVVDDRMPKINAATEIINANYEIATLTRNVLLTKDIQQARKEADAIPARRETVKKSLEKLEAGLKTEEGKRLLAGVMAARAKYGPALDEFVKLVNSNERERAHELLTTKMDKAHEEYIVAVDKLIEFLTDLAKKNGQEAGSQAQVASWTIVVASLIAIVLAIVVALMIIRKVTAQLGGEPDYAAEVVKTIAGGDLSRKIQTRPGDESSLLASMKAMQENLKQTISQIKESVETINTAAQEIAAGNSDLSQRTEEQASSLEETASSIEELTSTVKQNADNAAHANTLAHNASEIAIKGGEVVGNVVDTMSGINEASRKIVDIISVIDGIAFQTNILALNAAVEAARAGEQGRGFAVVAGEVRNLAQRSAAAAKEIKLLINDSVDRVEGGSKLVEEAGQTMAEVVSSVRRVSEIINEISNASMEQSTGIEQVNQAIAQMDQVTQQNAALVEEAAAAAESLEDQAQNLAEAIAVFKMDHSAAGAAIVSARSRVATSLPVSSKPASKKLVATSGSKPVAKPAMVGADDDEWKEF